MTVSTATNRIEHTGDGVTDAFVFNFRVDDAAHLQVFVAGVLKTITTHYTVADIGEPDGGTVTFTPGNIPALDALVVLLRVVPVTQETQYPIGSKFPSATVELGFDRVTMIVQQAVEKLRRALTFATQSPTDDIVVPEPVAQALMRWKQDLSGLENVTVSGLGGSNIAVITGQGDLIQGGTSGVPEALPIGAPSAVLSVVAGKAAWATVTDWLVALGLISAKGDLISSTGAVADKLAVGTDGQILSADAASPVGLKWIAQPVTQTAPTGASMDYWGATAPAGWVLLSGRTIGSAASGATERANADTEDLYTLLWDSIANAELPIQDSAGANTTRGASAAADFAANKRLPVPDARGRGIVGKDDMGGSAAGRMTDAAGGIDGTVLGRAGGAQTHSLLLGEMPSHVHTYDQPNAAVALTIQNPADNLQNVVTGVTAGRATSSSGGGGAHKNVQPGIVANKIIKL